MQHKNLANEQEHEQSPDPQDEDSPTGISEVDNSLELRVAAFKKIYRGLQNAQRNIDAFKSDFLMGKSLLTNEQWVVEINQHCKEKPHSRTAAAWDLAGQHYLDCTGKNPDLVNAMYKYAFENTKYFGTTFFSHFRKAPVFSKEQIEQGEYAAHSIGYYIKYNLDFSSKPDNEKPAELPKP